MIAIISTKAFCLLKDDHEITHLNIIEVQLSNEPMNDDLMSNLLFECQCAIFLYDCNVKKDLDSIQSIIQNKIIQRKHHFPYLKLIVASNKNDSLNKASNNNIANEIVNLLPDRIQFIEVSLNAPRQSLSQLFQMIYEFESNVNNKLSSNIVKLSSRYEIESKCITFKVILLGNSTVGKTAFISRHFNNSFNESILPSIGMEYALELVSIHSNIQINLQVWDTAGQERFRSIPRKYYRKFDAILLMFSIDSCQSFKDVSEWVNDISNEANIDFSNQDSETSTLFLLGNKCDLEDKRVISRKKAEKKAHVYGMKYYEISCKSNINIDEVIADISLRCYSKSSGVKDLFDIRPTLHLNGNFSKSKTKCCKS